MKLLYITSPSFFDLEISLINSLSKKVEINVLMLLSPAAKSNSAFTLNDLKKEINIYGFNEYSDLEKYKNLIDTNKWFIGNCPNNSLKTHYLLSRKVIRYIKDFNPDMIHCTSNVKSSLFLIPYLLNHKDKLFTLHDPVPHNTPTLFSKLTFYFLIKSYCNILLLSDIHQKFITKKYNVKTFLSKLGVYDYLNKFEIKTNPYGDYILFFGRISPYKGVDILLKSYLASKASEIGVKLIIAGKGKVEEELESSNIIFLNRYIDNNELANLIYFSKFVVLPYKSATQSGVLMSAFAFNKPILATNVGDFSIHIKDYITGLIVEPNSIKSFAEGINILLEEDLAQYENNIAYKISTIYSWDRIADSLIETYEEIITNNKR